MAANPELATPAQAEELFDTVFLLTTARDKDMLTPKVWDGDVIDLPGAVRERLELSEAAAQNYKTLVMFPGSDTADTTGQAVINFLKLNPPTLSVKDHIQYRISLADAAQYALERHLMGQPPEFKSMDAAQDLAKFRESVTEADQIPDDPMEGFYLAARHVIDNLDERMERRHEAERLAGQLGLSLVFADEAQSLIDLFSH